MTAWTLHGTTAQPSDAWPRLRADLTGWHAAWADLDGVHVTDALPAALPVTSHLWAWTAGGWLRVRTDGDRWWASALLHGATLAGPLWKVAPETVGTVMRDEIWSWGPDDGRVAQMRRVDDVRIPERMVQLVPVRAQPVVFVGDLASAAAL